MRPALCGDTDNDNVEMSQQVTTGCNTMQPVTVLMAPCTSVQHNVCLALLWMAGLLCDATEDLQKYFSKADLMCPRCVIPCLWLSQWKNCCGFSHCNRSPGENVVSLILDYVHPMSYKPTTIPDTLEVFISMWIFCCWLMERQSSIRAWGFSVWVICTCAVKNLSYSNSFTGWLSWNLIDCVNSWLP